MANGNLESMEVDALLERAATVIAVGGSKCEQWQDVRTELWRRMMECRTGQAMLIEYDQRIKGFREAIESKNRELDRLRTQQRQDCLTQSSVFIDRDSFRQQLSAARHENEMLTIERNCLRDRLRLADTHLETARAKLSALESAVVKKRSKRPAADPKRDVAARTRNGKKSVKQTKRKRKM
jgi:regulator of replication initiation timing